MAAMIHSSLPLHAWGFVKTLLLALASLSVLMGSAVGQDNHSNANDAAKSAPVAAETNPGNARKW